MSSLVTKNIFWLSVSRVAAMAVLAVAYAMLSRYLGVFGMGQYQFVLSYVLIFSTLADFGIQQFVTKKISEEPEETEKYFQSFFAFEVFLSLTLYCLLVGVALARGFDQVVFLAVAVAGLGLIANALTFPFLAVMTAAQDLRKVAVINFLNSLVNIAIIFLAISFNRYIVFLAGVQLIFGVIDLILYRRFIARHLPGLRVFQSLRLLDFGLIKNILKYAWPFVLLVGFSAIYNRIDMLLITNLLGYEQTGLYAVAYKFFDILAFFPSVVSHTLYPFFAGLMVKRAIMDVRMNLEKYMRVMVAVALPMAVGGTILAEPLVLLFGQEFRPAAPVLAVLVWAIAALFIYIPVNSLVISQLTKFAVIITGVNVAINIAGNLLLLPRFGIQAAAIMTVVSESLQGIFYFYFVYRNITQFNVLKIILKPLVAALAMGFVLWQIKGLFLPLAIVSGAGVYGLALLLTGFITKHDVQLVKNIFRPQEA